MFFVAPYNYNNCSVIHRATWVVFSIEITRASILLYSRILKFFLIPSLLQFRIQKFQFPLYGENLSQVGQSPSQPREKKKHWPQPAFVHALIVSPWLCEPFTNTDRIWSRWSARNVPFHLTKLFSPGPLICILLTCMITKLAVALVWSLQLECTFHWACGFSEISNRNFCWMESA